MGNSLITSSPEIMGGTPVFAGTRVPVNGFSVPGQILSHGDRLRVGRSIFVYVDREEVDDALLTVTLADEEWNEPSEHWTATSPREQLSCKRSFGSRLRSIPCAPRMRSNRAYSNSFCESFPSNASRCCWPATSRIGLSLQHTAARVRRVKRHFLWMSADQEGPS